MMDGFDLESPLVCEGIIGDGCGGGRIFFIDADALYVYDPTTKESRKLLSSLQGVKSLSKSKCIITLDFEDKKREFDLSEVE